MTLVADRITLDTIPEFRLRDNDEAECLAAGFTGQSAVRRFVSGSTQAYAHYIDGDLVCLWGFRWDDYSTKTAVMWLLSTDAVLFHQVAFGRASRKFLKVLLSELSEITVLVHNNYTTAIEWLAWLGFKHSRALTEQFTEMRKERV